MSFAVVGSRPSSARSGSRPGSAGRKHHHGYHTRADNSSVDESLFGSHHHTKLNDEINFKAPWEEKKPDPPRNTFAPLPDKPKKKEKNNKPSGQPLIWSPPATGGTATHTYTKNIHNTNNNNNNNNNAASSATRSSSGYLWNDCNQSGKFRHLRHTPTYVDESLFGSRLQEASFTAPWNERKKGEKKKARPAWWNPSVDSLIPKYGIEISLEQTSRGRGAHPGQELRDKENNSSSSLTLASFRAGLRRPATAIGTRGGSSSGKGGPLPVWKP